MRKRWMPHCIAIAGLLVFSVLGLGSMASLPTAAAAIPTPAAEPEPAPAATAPGAIVDVTMPGVISTPPRTVAPVENIGHDARVSQAPWSAHTIIPSKNYTVVGSVVVRNTDSTTVLADLMERAIALGGHDIKNVIITHSITDDGARVSSAIAVVIRYTNETLMVREERIIDDLHRIEERYIHAPRDVRTPW